VLPLDITKHDQHEAAFAEVLKVYGHIDILVLNSGIYENKPAILTDITRIQELMNVNFLSFVALTKVVLPTMIEKNHGKVSVLLDRTNELIV
jgi:gluconate 5-dehydrogenase